MESEIKMLAQGSVDMTTSGIEEQISVEELRKAREEAARLFVHEDILRYIVEIANETRRSRDLELESVQEERSHFYRWQKQMHILRDVIM